MQDIRKKHLNSRSDFPISREITPRNSTTISHAALGGVTERQPRFIKSDDISLYKNPMGRRGDFTEEDEDYTPKKSGQGADNKKTLRKITSLASYFALFAIVFGVYYTLTYVFDRATITITPNYKDVTLSAVPLSLGEKGDVPFEVVSTELTKSKSLPKTTTTTVDKKASGQITIFNNYSESPQRLVKFTRFESTAKKIYKIQDSVVIPGKKGTTPGEITVKVIAEDEGPSYNIENDTFTIPGFKGKEQFATMSAKTAGSITGGASGSKAIVALTDLNAAKDEIAVKLREAASKEFSARSWDKKIPVLDSLSLTVEDNSKEILQGESDNYTAKAIGSIAVVEGSALSKVALTGDVNKALSYTFVPGKDFAFSVNKDSKLASSTLVLTMTGNSRIIWNTDYAAIKSKLVGKSRKDFTTLITNDKSISSATISIFPPWKTGFPTDKESVTIKEKLPDYKL